MYMEMLGYSNPVTLPLQYLLEGGWRVGCLFWCSAVSSPGNREGRVWFLPCLPSFLKVRKGHFLLLF